VAIYHSAWGTSDGPPPGVAARWHRQDRPGARQPGFGASGTTSDEQPLSPNKKPWPLCMLAASAQEGVAGFAGRTRVHLHSFDKVVLSGRIVFASRPNASPGGKETSCPSFPADPTSISFVARHESCSARRQKASPSLPPGFERCLNGSRCQRPASRGPRLRLPKLARAESRSRTPPPVVRGGHKCPVAWRRKARLTRRTGPTVVLPRSRRHQDPCR